MMSTAMFNIFAVYFIIQCNLEENQNIGAVQTKHKKKYCWCCLMLACQSHKAHSLTFRTYIHHTHPYTCVTQFILYNNKHIQIERGKKNASCIGISSIKYWMTATHFNNINMKIRAISWNIVCRAHSVCVLFVLVVVCWWSGAMWQINYEKCHHSPPVLYYRCTLWFDFCFFSVVFLVTSSTDGKIIFILFWIYFMHTIFGIVDIAIKIKS